MSCARQRELACFVAFRRRYQFLFFPFSQDSFLPFALGISSPPCLDTNFTPSLLHAEFSSLLCLDTKEAKITTPLSDRYAIPSFACNEWRLWKLACGSNTHSLISIHCCAPSARQRVGIGWELQLNRLSMKCIGTREADWTSFPCEWLSDAGKIRSKRWHA